jgi:hypothetical protein
MIPTLIEWLKQPIILERWMFITLLIIGVVSLLWMLCQSEFPESQAGRPYWEE